MNLNVGIGPHTHRGAIEDTLSETGLVYPRVQTLVDSLPAASLMRTLKAMDSGLLCPDQQGTQRIRLVVYLKLQQ